MKRKSKRTRSGSLLSFQGFKDTDEDFLPLVFYDYKAAHMKIKKDGVLYLKSRRPERWERDAGSIRSHANSQKEESNEEGFALSSAAMASDGIGCRNPAAQEEEVKNSDCEGISQEVAEVQPAPPQFEEGGQATVDDLL